MVKKVETSAAKRGRTPKIENMAFIGYKTCTDLKSSLDEATFAIEAEEIYFVYSSSLCTAHHYSSFLQIEDVL